jgi:hypothetical protein
MPDHLTRRVDHGCVGKLSVAKGRRRGYSVIQSNYINNDLRLEVIDTSCSSQVILMLRLCEVVGARSPKHRNSRSPGGRVFAGGLPARRARPKLRSYAVALAACLSLVLPLSPCSDTNSK